MAETQSARRAPNAVATTLGPGLAALERLPPLRWHRAAFLIVGFFVLWLVLQSIVGAVLVGVVEVLAGEPQGLTALSAGGFATTTAIGAAVAAASLLATLITVAVLRGAGGPGFRAMGLSGGSDWPREVVLGAALGPIAFGLVLAVELLLGWASVGRGHVDAPGLALGALTYLGVGAYEEMFARGFLLQVFARAAGSVPALLLSSVVFAGLHAINPNASLLAIVGLVIAGLVFASGYLVTGRLWLPIAFHWSWNFAQGPLFGFPVSGVAAGSLLTVAPTGPDWLTGGALGPEAGALGLLAEAVAVVLMLAWRRAGSGWPPTLAVVALAGVAVLFLGGLLAGPAAQPLVHGVQS